MAADLDRLTLAQVRRQKSPHYITYLLFGFILICQTAEAQDSVPTGVERNKDVVGSKSADRLSMRKLSVETYGQYTFQPQTTNGTLSDYALGGNGQSQLNYVLPTMQGPGLGARLVAEFLPKISFFAGAEFKSLGIKYKGYSQAVAGSPATTLIIANIAQEIYYKNWMINLGARAKTDLLWGEVYGGLGIGIILPFQSNELISYSYLGGYGTLASSVKSMGTIKNFNLGLAGIAEIGYQYPITNRVCLTISLNILFGSVSNAGKTSETTTYYGNDTSTKTTREYRKSFTLDEAATYSASSNYTSSLAIYESLNITDIGIRGAVSFQLYSKNE